MPVLDARAFADLRRRLDAVVAEAGTLQAEGLPFPTQQIQAAFEEAVQSQSVETATQMVKRAEALIDRVRKDWTWVKELLRRADELRAIAATIGVDLALLDARVGNPRTRLQADPLSAGSLEKAAASASLALAVLNDAVPKFCVQEAQSLGGTIRQARDRGEEVRDAAASFSRLLLAIQDQNLPTAAQRLVETRRAVARIPRAPALPSLTPQEEEEILLEARNLARRLQRIKSKARDASSAARLMTQVRAALSDERRYGTPEEEVEALWLEVDRLTREKKLTREGPPLPGPGPRPPVPMPDDDEDDEGEELPDDGPPSPTARGSADGDEEERPSFYVPYVPPEISDDPNGGDAGLAGRSNRPRNRPRAPP